MVCTGIRHLAVAPTRADSTVQFGNDRMPLDIRIDWQAVDGHEQGMFPCGARSMLVANPSLNVLVKASGPLLARSEARACFKGVGGRMSRVPTSLIGPHTSGLPRWGVVMKMTRRTSAIGLKTIDPCSSSRAFAGPARFSKFLFRTFEGG